MHDFEFSTVPPGYGYYSRPPIAAEQLGIEAELGQVPQSGAVLDIGAGIGVSLGAFIYTRRPDLRIIAIDPGYILGTDDMTDEVFEETTINHFEPHEQELLRGSDAWRSDLRVGSGEEIPVEDDSVDLVVSYAAVPAYARSLGQVMEETVRVLKVGGVALYGPMHDHTFEGWNSMAEAAVASKKVAHYTFTRKPAGTSGGGVADAYFTHLTR